MSALFGTLLALITSLPLAWKWQLGLRRTAVGVLMLALFSSSLVAALARLVAMPVFVGIGLVWLMTLTAALAILACRFYRDPERLAPHREDVIVSPADGTVLYVHKAASGILPVSTKQGRHYALEELSKTPLQSGNAVVIGIGMSFLDVHVNRAPIAGRITLQRHFPGRFGSLRRIEMVFENERMTTLIEQNGFQVAVVQIASRLVRQIASFVHEGQEVALGQRIGVIRLGSQVDLALPAREDVRVIVKPGAQVKAGACVIATFKPAVGGSLGVSEPALETRRSQARPAGSRENGSLRQQQILHSSIATDVASTRVIVIDPQADARWHSYVTSHPDGLIYHHPAWLKVIERAYGHQPLCLASEDADGQLRGILPMFQTHGLLTGRRLSSLPHTPVGGPLADDDEITAALVKAAIDRVQSEPSASLEVKLHCSVDRARWGESASHWLVTTGICVPCNEIYVLELPEQPEALRFGNSRNHARIQWAINKAVKLGVDVRPAETEEDLRAWYRLYLDAMRWHAVPPRPYRFFQVAWQLLPPLGLMRLLLAEQRVAGARKLLAGSIFLMFGRIAFYAFNGRRRQDLALRPNDMIQWYAIHDAYRAGFRCYDFGEVEATQQGLAEFKSKWGGKPRRLYRYYYPALRDVRTIAAFKAGSAPRRCVNAAWRRLPLQATAILGDWIYRLM